MKKTVYGFTIVELLIVIVVIAILATISIVAYNGVQQRGRIAVQQAAATQTERAIMAYALQANGESISLGGSLLGYKEEAGDVDLLRPLTGVPNITMYAVYSVAGTSVNYPSVARLSPSTTGSNIFQLYCGPSGSNQMGYRIDTPSQTNATALASGVRIPGNTVIGWMQVSGSATARAYGFNQAIAAGTNSLTSHSGWNFTGLSLTSHDGTGRMALVFNAAHDQTTRTQVIGWLAERYGVSL